MKHRTLAAVLTAFIALGAVAPNAMGQVNLAVNDLSDRPDTDLTNLNCDCDAVVAGDQCSLRAALQNANLLGGWVIISLGAQVYGLNYGGTDDAGVAGDLDIFSSILTRLTIQGAGVTVIDGAGLISGGTPDRIFHITNSVANACEIELVNLSISNGAGVQRGAGVRQDGGRLTLSDVNISDCAANDQGGGIYTSTTQVFAMSGGGVSHCSAQFNGGGVLIDTPALAQVTLNNVGISNCVVSQKGGGVRTSAGSNAILSNCAISGCSSTSGGGVSVRGMLQMLDCAVSGNFATPGTGGGIANDIGGSLSMERCGITSNSGDIAGGLNNSSGATLFDCTVDQNTSGTGAGIYNTSTGTPLHLHRCTISGNTAFAGTGGGGYRGFGLLEMVNCTISSNRAPNGSGGGMYLDGLLGSIEINDCTIADNSSMFPGAGILTDATLGVSSVAVIGTIVGQNFLTGGGSSNFFDLTGTMPLLSAGANLDSDATCGFNTASDQSNVPAGIMPLFNNGGFTRTHALAPGSLAIDRGSCFTVSGNAITEDQRSQPRVSPCDCGSYESSLSPPPSNDNCLAALPVLPGILSFNNFGATTDGPPEPCGFTGQPNLDSDVWFQYVALCGGTTVITITPVPPSPPNRLLAVYNACPPPGGAPTLVCASAIGGASATGTITHVAGQVFIIRSGVPLGLQGDSMLDITVSCACPADIAPPPSGDNVVGVADLLAVISNWGACPPSCPPACVADIAPSPTGDCNVGVADLLMVIGNWGPCP